GVVFDAGKAEREPAGVTRARLDVVERDFAPEPWCHLPRVAVVGYRKLAQFLGLPRQHLVGHALEGLAEHDKPAGFRIACAQMQVAEPSAGPAGSALDSESHEIERDRGRDFERAAAAPTGFVWRGGRLGSDTRASGRSRVLV